MNISEEELAIAVTSSISNSVHDYNKFLAENRSILDSPESRLQVYNAVSVNTDYLNCGLIQKLTNLFGSPDTKHKMKIYASKIENFRKTTSLVVYAKVQHPPMEEIPSDLHSIVTKHSWTNATLEDVEQFRLDHARQYGLLHFIAIISSIKEGSVVVTWFIPKLFASYLRKRIMMTHDDLFRESGITQVEMDGIILYSSSARVRL